MNWIFCSTAAFAVVLLCGIWRTQQHVARRRRRLVRERIAYMLWVIAQRVDRETSLPAR